MMLNQGQPFALEDGFVSKATQAHAHQTWYATHQPHNQLLDHIMWQAGRLAFEIVIKFLYHAHNTYPLTALYPHKQAGTPKCPYMDHKKQMTTLEYPRLLGA